MKELMTAVLAVCPKVRGSASDLRQVDVRSRHCAQCPPQPYRRNGQEERGSMSRPLPVLLGPGRFGRMRRWPWRRWSWCRIQHWEAITGRAAREAGLHADGNDVVLKDGRAAFQSVFHIDLHVVPRQNGDKLSFAKGMLLRRHPDRDKTGRTLREALEKIDATE